MSISWLQCALSRGRVTSRDLVEHYTRRTDRLNADLRAVLGTNPDAGRLADASDERRRTGCARGPLEGIPVLLKGNVDTADAQPTTAGSLAMLGNRPSRDAFVVRQLTAAGAVVLGKTNLSEWANFRSGKSSSGWSAVGGQTANPHVLDRNPSGSSSGSAVAVAAGLAAASIGTETDGSIVSPAAANGVVGIKPTLGLLSRSGIVPISAQQDTPGPMTQSVRDAAILLGAMTGVDPDDPATRGSDGRARTDYTDCLDAASLRGARIGVWREGLVGISAGTDRVLDHVLGVLRDAGALVVDATDLPYQEEIRRHELPSLQREFRHDLDGYLAATGGEHPASLAEVIAFNLAHVEQELSMFGQDIFLAAQATGGDLTDADYLAGRKLAGELARASIDETVERYELDAIVAPTNAPAWRTDPVRGDAHELGSSTPAAVAGYPSITVPMGFVGPLPVGISFLGPRWSEPRLLGLAYAFEQATCARRRPRGLPTC